MRLTEFMIVIIAALMFLIPTMKKEQVVTYEREAQEEDPLEEISDTELNTFKISYQVMSPDEEPVADIIWMKKAAEVARDEGVPYFNVVKQDIRKRFVKKYNMELSVIEGVIQLDNDPMRAEFDANEIESLIHTEE